MEKISLIFLVTPFRENKYGKKKKVITIYQLDY
jgi:hypothetical protein